MKKIQQLTLSSVVIAGLSGILFIGCTQSSTSIKKPADEQHAMAMNQTNQKYSEEELGLRKSDLYQEDTVVTARLEYTDRQPGTGKTLNRAFENAPPMIPHSVEGMLPIMKDNNMCLSCHMPEIASSMNATAIPKSHFANFRPKTEIAADGSVIKEGKKINNTSDVKTVVHASNDLYQGRFNCSQCHAPQANVPLAVANDFEPDFRSQNANKKSNLIDILNEGVK